MSQVAVSGEETDGSHHYGLEKGEGEAAVLHAKTWSASKSWRTVTAQPGLV